MNGQVSDTGSPARAQSRLRLLFLDLVRLERRAVAYLTAVKE
jgi:hypothetical protein